MRRILIVLVALHLTSLLGFADAPEGTGALVVGIVGVWHNSESGQKQIHFGDALTDDSQVTCADSGSMTLLLHRVGHPATLKCDSKNATTRIKDFADKNADRPVSKFFSQLFEVVHVQLSNEPRKFVTAVSRDFGVPQVEECVLKLSGKQVDVGPALATASAGDYQLVLFPLTDETPDGPPSEVHWQPGGTAMMAVSGVVPGLMKIALMKDGTPTSIAWALVVDGASFSDKAKQFGEARELVSHWPGATHGQAARTVLRAYLEELGGKAR